MKSLSLERETFLAWRGKEILLKVVALSIPIYAMRYFKLYEIFCAELDNLMTHFGGDKRRVK